MDVGLVYVVLLPSTCGVDSFSRFLNSISSALDVWHGIVTEPN
jgi:purine-cytosine permease-like protein